LPLALDVDALTLALDDDDDEGWVTGFLAGLTSPSSSLSEGRGCLTLTFFLAGLTSSSDESERVTTSAEGALRLVAVAGLRAGLMSSSESVEGGLTRGGMAPWGELGERAMRRDEGECGEEERGGEGTVRGCGWALVGARWCRRVSELHSRRSERVEVER